MFPPRAAGLALVALALATSSCAYYNTFYLARKNYEKATEGAPYLLDRTQSQHAQLQYFNKSVEYAKKVLASYPKSKWVDDAYVLWARGLLGQNDPLQTVNMLRDFTERYPDSPLRAEATFYLGVGQRQARRYGAALVSFDEFLKLAPKHSLVPYALLESARCLVALERPAEAADATGQLLDRYPKSVLVTEARRTRADARVAKGDFAGAREDFRYLGAHATTEEDRLVWLLREADCLEGARDHDGSLALLRGALAHERPPVTPTASAPTTSPGGGGTIGAPGTTYGTISSAGTTGGADRYGRILLRIGTAHLLAGRIEPALQSYRDVLRDYPRTALGAEAQYRIGYAYETAADDFDRARAEYAKVKEQGSGGGYSDQAGQRLGMLDRLAQFRTAGGDTLEKRAEAGLVRAELYLFQQDKPERALQEYQRLAEELKGTAYEAKAMTAQAWVLSRKLDRPTEADSILWAVVHQHPATEAQLAARDYLELRGQSVPQDLIRMPERLLAHSDTTHLTEPPLVQPPLAQGSPGPGSPADSARGAGPGWQQAIFRPQPPSLRMPPSGIADTAGYARGPGVPPDSGRFASAAPAPFDSSGTVRGPLLPPVATAASSPGDTAGPAGTLPRGPRSPDLTRALPDTAIAPADTARVRPDSLRQRADLARMRLDSLRNARGLRPDSLRLRPDSLRLRPDTLRSRPDTLRARPGPTRARPDTARVRPDTTRVRPGATPAHPDSVRVQPAPRAPRRPVATPARADSARKRP